MLKSNTF